VVVATAGEEEGVGSKSPVVAALEKEGVGDVGRVQSLTDDDRQEKGAWILGRALGRSEKTRYMVM
jgi:hypothetical protein